MLSCCYCTDKILEQTFAFSLVSKQIASAQFRKF